MREVISYRPVKAAQWDFLIITKIVVFFGSCIKGGLGLGLYLIKKMIGHNGGKIEVESEPNEGTTFKLHLREYK